MKSAIHIQLKEDQQQLPYQTDFRQLMSTKFPEVDFFELDNRSEPEMVNYALEMIRRSTLILVVVESKSDKAHPAKLIRLFNRINREKPDHLHLILLGKHPVVEKMLRPMVEKFSPEADMQQLASKAADLFA